MAPVPSLSPPSSRGCSLAQPNQYYSPSLMAHQVRDCAALGAAHEQHQKEMQRTDNPGGAGKNPPFSGAVKFLLLSDWEGKLAAWSGDPTAFQTKAAPRASLKEVVIENCQGASSSSSGGSGDDDSADGVDDKEWEE